MWSGFNRRGPISTGIGKGLTRASGYNNGHAKIGLHSLADLGNLAPYPFLAGSLPATGYSDLTPLQYPTYANGSHHHGYRRADAHLNQHSIRCHRERGEHPTRLLSKRGFALS